jgi:hypothetical protein
LINESEIRQTREPTSVAPAFTAFDELLRPHVRYAIASWTRDPAAGLFTSCTMRVRRCRDTAMPGRARLQLVRTDRIDSGGSVTVRHNSRLHHIGLGTRLAGTPIMLLIDNCTSASSVATPAT